MTTALKNRLLPSNWPVVTWRLWHAGLLGSGVVAYLTADEDTYRLHQFSGYLFATLAVGRLLLALSPLAKGPLTLRRPSRPTLPKRWSRGAIYQVVRPWMALLLVGALLLAGLSGIGADWIGPLEKIHESLGDLTPWVVLAHAVVVVALLARLPNRRVVASLTLMGAGLLSLPTMAGEGHQTLLTELTRRAQAESPSFSGFDAKRGETLFLSRNTATPDLPSCTSCHTSDPRSPGKHAKTGRSIDPMAVSANPTRFTDLKQFDKRFSRDCDTVLGRPCTAQEQGDFAAYMISR